MYKTLKRACSKHILKSLYIVFKATDLFAICVVPVELTSLLHMLERGVYMKNLSDLPYSIYNLFDLKLHVYFLSGVKVLEKLTNKIIF